MKKTTDAVKILKRRYKQKTSKQKLAVQCKKLWPELFKGLPCAICQSYGIMETQTCGHHLIPKKRNAYYKYDINNGVPLCSRHHLFSDDIAPHSTNALAVRNFLTWLRRYLPNHYRWYIKNNGKNLGNKLDLNFSYGRLLECKEHKVLFWKVVYENQQQN